MNELLVRQIEKQAKKISELHKFLDIAAMTQKIEQVEARMSIADFWDDQGAANKQIKEMKALKGILDPLQEAQRRITDAQELLELSEDDQSMEEQIAEELESLKEVIGKLEIQMLLSGPYDGNSAILSINAGAGGTESCDWASMLLRMYVRWAESKGYSVDIFDELAGEEAGIKNASMRIEGDKAYGYLKAEKGVHRLVRISPFDSNKRRHTSFVSVDIIPEIEDEGEVDINPDDLKVDVFRSSGPGGQSVNTTDSAVRITHIPSGVVVQSQNERSQLMNKQRCMHVLAAKLAEIKRQEHDDKLSAEAGTKQKIEWGSQIRSYVLQPYQMIKDHRTDAEIGNVQRVLDGDIDMFIEAFLKWRP